MEKVVPPAKAPHTYKRKVVFDVLFWNEAADKLNVAPVVEVEVAIFAAYESTFERRAKLIDPVEICEV